MLKGRISHSLMIKFYLWFLLTITLTVIIMGSFLILTSDREFDEHFKRWATSELEMVRNILSNLFNSGLTPEQISRIFEPITKDANLSLVVMVSGQREYLISVRREGNEKEALKPTEAHLEKALRKGRLFEFHEVDHGVKVLTGVPIDLPGNRQGAFFLIFQKNRFKAHSHEKARPLMIILLFLLVVWVLLLPLARHLARPLQEMAKTADALGRGDLDARITLKGHRKGAVGRGDEIHRLAVSFNRMAENLKHQVISHKQLLGDISHELRTPLARLRVALELARDDSTPPRGEYLDRVEKQADELDSLISELLLFSQLESTPYQLNRERLSPAKIIEETVSVYGEHPEAGGLALRFEPKVENLTASMDRRLITRALENVLRNAITHAPGDSSITLSLSLSEQAGEPPSARIEVLDEGPGVPPEMLERIFSPFVRMDRARSRETGGVGLGLAIARRCMEAHGGGIRAESGDSGRGLKVILWWPLEGNT